MATLRYSKLFTVLYNSPHVSKDEVLQHQDLICDITEGRLRPPKFKQMAGLTYDNRPVYRAKIDKKHRLIYTYVLYNEKETLKILSVNAHNYGKLKRLLTSKKAETYEYIELSDEAVEAPCVKTKPPESAVTFTSFGSKSFVLDECQTDGIALHPAVLFSGPPGAGKTLLLYKMMCRILEEQSDILTPAWENESEKEKEKEKEHEFEPPLPTLFMSQSQYSLNILKGMYEQMPLSQRAPVLFSTWEGLLQMHYPDRTKVSSKQFAQWLTKNRCNQPPDIVHYEFSLIMALSAEKSNAEKSGAEKSGAEEYLAMGARQCYFSGQPQLQQKILALLKIWQEHLDKNNLVDPMVSTLHPQTPQFFSVFGDELQNLPPIAAYNLVKLTKAPNFVGSLDVDQCLTSSPLMLGCFKEALHKAFGHYTERRLPHTWRCTEQVADSASYFLNAKYALDVPGARRPYNAIISAKKTEGLVSWVDDAGLAQLHPHGASADTVVISGSLTEKDRKEINLSLGTNNILSPSQVIGAGFDVVIIWKPLSTSECLISLAKNPAKLQRGLTLQQCHALNGLYVSMTRSQNTVFIYEPEEHIRIGIGAKLLSNLPLNKTSPLQNQTTPEQNSTKWNELVDRYLQESQTEVARDIMKYHLNMNETEIEKKIASLNPEKEYAPQHKVQAPPQTQAVPNIQESHKENRRKKRTKNQQHPKPKPITCKNVAPKPKPPLPKENGNALKDPGEVGKKFIMSLFDGFTEKKLAVAMSLFTKSPNVFWDWCTYEGEVEGRKIPSLLNYIQSDVERQKIFLSCLINQPLYSFSNIPFEKVVQYLKNKPFQTQLLNLLGTLKKIGIIVSTTENKYCLRRIYSNKATNKGETAAYVAAEKGFAGVLDTFKKLGADLSKANNNGATPAFIAAQNGHVNVLEKLKEWEMDLDKPLKSGETPAYVAAQEGQDGVLKVLWKWGADFNIANDQGGTPAFAAAQNGHAGVLETLKKGGADLNKALKSGETPAFAAAQNGHIKALKKLKKLGANLDIVNNYGQTLSSIAAQNGHVAILEKLGKWGADLNKALKTGETPAYFAAQNGHDDVLKMLKKLDANFNIVNSKGQTLACVAAKFGQITVLKTLKELDEDLTKASSNGITPAFIAAHNGNVAILKLLRELEPDADLNKTDNDGIPLAFIAAQNGHPMILEVLKDWRVDLANVLYKGQTLACIAAQFGHVELLKTLKRLEPHLDLNIASENGITPAHAAAQNGNVAVLETLKALEPNLDVNKADNNGFTPAGHAAQNRHTRVLKRLKKWGADLNIGNCYGSTPAYSAAYMGHIDVLKMLKKLGADLNIGDKNDLTPVYIAARLGNVSVLEALYELKADLDKADNNGDTPAFTAAEQGHAAVIKVLSKLGAKINKANHDKVTPAHVASHNGHLAVLEVLNELHTDFNCVDKDGITPAYTAAQFGRVDVLEALSKWGANLNQQTPNGDTPAYVAAHMGHIAVLETLEKLGADLNLANNEGTTPVFIAAQNGNIPMMEALVKLGADINIYNKCGATPLFIVSQNGCKKSVEFLISKGAQWDHPYVSSRSSLLKFCEAYSSDVLKRLEDTIDEQLKDPAKDEEHIAL